MGHGLDFGCFLGEQTTLDARIRYPRFRSCHAPPSTHARFFFAAPYSTDSCALMPSSAHSMARIHNLLQMDRITRLRTQDRFVNRLRIGADADQGVGNEIGFEQSVE